MNTELTPEARGPADLPSPAPEPGTSNPRRSNVMAHAHRMQIYASTLIPGPLQVYGYREALRADPLARQCGHTDSEPPSGIPITAVLEESVLHHHVGGHDVMSAQILHVLGLLTLESEVSVAVIPLHAGRTPRYLPMEPFVIIDGRYVLLPVTPVPLLLDYRGQVDRYTSAFHRLRQIALTGMAAHDYLAGHELLSAIPHLDDLMEGRKPSCAATA